MDSIRCEPLDLRDWLREHAGRSTGELVDALQCDQLRRWERGERVPAEAYLQLLAESAGDCAADDEQALDLIYAELLLRRQAGEAPSLAEYEWRFPAHAVRLGLLLDLDEHLEGETVVRNEPRGDSTPEWPRSTMSHRPGLPSIRRYDVLEEVGRGGMGVVYKARQIALNRTVALKIIPSANAEARARFRVEAEAVARLQHPNIVQIHEVGHAEVGPYMALEFVAGGSLAQRLKLGPLAIQEAADLVETLARAVHFAHQRGILHRDLKPGNILLESVENALRPKVADFGLAKLLEDVDADQTRTGDILGTPCYMSPEQASGESQDVGTPTDIHALGAILYEGLTGRPPFRGENSYSTMEQVRFHEPLAPRRVRMGVPRDLDTICLKCLRKEPSRRYASADELANDLRRYSNGEPILARRTGPLGRAKRWIARNPALAATLAIALVTIASVSSIGLFQVLEERERYRGERDVARTNLYRARLGEARAQMKARDTGWRWLALENLREAGALQIPDRDPVELRDLAAECMGSEHPCFRLHATWEGHDGPVTAIACRPDGRLAASGSRDTTVRLWSLIDGQPRAVLNGHSKAITGLAFAPDGKTLASCSTDGRVRLWDSDDPARAPQVRDLNAGPIRGIAFSPDGRWLAAACGNGTVRLLPHADPDNRTEIVLTGHAGAVTCLAFSGTEELATGGEDRTIRFWDVAAGKQMQSWPLQNVPTCLVYNRSKNSSILAWGDGESRMMHARGRDQQSVALQMSPHANGITGVGHYRGNLWLTASADGTLKLWSQYNTWLSEVAVARGDYPAAHALAIAPTGERVLAGYRDGRVRCWELASSSQQFHHWVRSHNAVLLDSPPRLVDRDHVTEIPDGQGVASRSYAPPAIRGLVLHPTNATLAIARDDGTIESWDRFERRELNRWPAHDRSITALAGSPDGIRLASVSIDGTVKLWEWKSGALHQTLVPGFGAVHAVAWSRDGRSLAASGERGVVLWDLDRLDEPRRLSERSLAASSVALSPTMVAYSESDGGIEIRDLTTGAVRHRLRGHTLPATALEFAPDGKHLASAAGDDTIRIWDVVAGTEAIQIPLRFPAVTLGFRPDGRTLAYATVSAVYLFDIRQRKEAAMLLGAKQAAVVRFAGDGAAVFAGSKGGSVHACTMAEVERAEAVAKGTTDGVARSGSVRVDWPSTVVPGGHPDTWGMTASPDGRWVASAGHDGTVKLWDAATMRLVRTLEGHGDLVWSVAFSQDSRSLASGSGDIRIWEVETGRQLHCFEGHERLVTSLAFHPLRPWLASSSLDGSVRLWDSTSGRSLGLVHRFGQASHGVAFRPDGRWLVATDDTRLALWPLGDDPPTGPPSRVLSGHAAPVWSLAFSPDGRVLSAGFEQGTVVLWDGSTFERLVALRSGAGQIRGLAYSRDGERLAAAGYTAPTVVWDLPRLRQSLREMNLAW